MHGDYLLLAFGESTAVVSRLGGVKNLAGRPEFKPLQKFADKKLTSIGYVSQALRAKTSTTPEDIEEFAKLGSTLVEKVDLTAEQRKRIETDLKALAGDVKKFLTKPGAQMAFSFYSERGSESYSYDWTKHPELDGSKTLPLLSHAGGSPLLVTVSRARYS